MASVTFALPYEEPDIVTILILSSFLLLLNVVNYALDKIIYCGLIGQIFIGVGWGIPGTNWLSAAAQTTVVQFGYIGLILIVYEGGLSTSATALRANLFLSGLVACIGISIPIASSFILLFLLDITPLQAFAAGAALCSTSLGTTFTVLSTSGLKNSRLGIILTSAAMMDDVVGLVMVQVISTLGQTSTAFNAVTVVRPICVSIAFAVVIPLLCRYVVQPLTVWWYDRRIPKDKLLTGFKARRAMFIAHTGILLAFVTGSSYAGISNLFAAYLAGASITWWDGISSKLLEHSQVAARPPEEIAGNLELIHTSQQLQRPIAVERSLQTVLSNTATAAPTGDLPPTALTAVLVYEEYYAPAVAMIFRPFFFASIGFSIPITRMFEGSIVWRGIVYAVLMVCAKMICGLCLVRFGSTGTSLRRSKRSLVFRWMSSTSVRSKPTVPRETQRKCMIPKPLSLYPAAVLGSGLVARGEIGFLIASIAESNKVYGSRPSELFLVVTWAILLCTLFGPIAVGMLVRRIKSLRRNALFEAERAGRQDPLGVWGNIDTNVL